jgi:hypothetical protein
VATVGLLLGAVFLFSAVYQFSLAVIQGRGWTVIRVALGECLRSPGRGAPDQSLKHAPTSATLWK